VKLGKEFAVLFSVMFLPGLLTASTGVDPAAWDSIAYHTTLLAVAVPQILLVVYVVNLRTPGVASRMGWRIPAFSDLVSLLIALVTLGAALALVSLVVSLFPGDGSIWDPTVKWRFSRRELIPLVIVSSLAVGYREEIFYRSYLTVRGREIGLSPPVIVAASSLLFAAGHWYQGLAGFVTALVIGAALGVVFLWRGSLHGVAVAHGLYNAAVLLSTSGL